MRLFILLFPLLLFAQIDINTSKNIDQPTILAIFPEPASPEVDANVSIKLCFSEPLMPVRMPRAITLKQLEERKPWFFAKHLFNKKSKIVKHTVLGSIEQKENCLLFKPDSNLSVGFYEVHTKPIFLRTFGGKIVVKPITYRFYVPEVINGFKLPPEPDEEKNNATLLGIDFNGNGIRDDVERWIIKHYAKDPKYPKTKTAIALQYAWAAQKILENPTMESSKYEDNALACQYYWFNKKTEGLSGFEFGKFTEKHKVFGTPALKDKIFNTKERILRKFKYNAALSGHILTLRESKLSACKINIDTLEE